MQRLARVVLPAAALVALALPLRAQGCGVPASSANYGQGTPGVLGVPNLASSLPVPGAELGLVIESNSPSLLSPALLVVGYAPAALPAKNGTLLVQPAFSLAVLTPAFPQSLILTVALPADPALCGLHVYLQTLYTEGPYFVLSQGLELVFGG